MDRFKDIEIPDRSANVGSCWQSNAIVKTGQQEFAEETEDTEREGFEAGWKGRVSGWMFPAHTNIARSEPGKMANCKSQMADNDR